MATRCEEIELARARCACGVCGVNVIRHWRSHWACGFGGRCGGLMDLESHVAGRDAVEG